MNDGIDSTAHVDLHNGHKQKNLNKFEFPNCSRLLVSRGYQTFAIH